MSKQTFLPESMYTVDETMNYETLSAFYNSKLPVTGKVLRINSKAQLLEVYLGGNLTGIMPFSIATIYPTSKDDGCISPHIYELVGKTIQAKIVSFVNNNIYLSRKDNMLEALESLKTETEIEYAAITGFSNISAFCDIGAGILGRIPPSDFSTVRFNNIKDVGLKKGDIISVKITDFFDEENKFVLSRIAALPPVNSILNKGDVVIGKVFDAVPNALVNGYFVLINSSFCGVVDSPYIELKYGDKISTFIKKIKPNGQLKLTLVQKL